MQRSLSIILVHCLHLTVCSACDCTWFWGFQKREKVESNQVNRDLVTLLFAGLLRTCSHVWLMQNTYHNQENSIDISVIFKISACQQPLKWIAMYRREKCLGFRCKFYAFSWFECWVYPFHVKNPGRIFSFNTCACLNLREQVALVVKYVTFSFSNDWYNYNYESINREGMPE